MNTPVVSAEASNALSSAAPASAPPRGPSWMVAPLKAALMARGTSLDALLADVPEAGSDDRAMVELLDRAARIADGGAPLASGRDASVGAFGIVDYATRTAPTVRDALRTWCAHFQSACPLASFRLVETENAAPRLVIEASMGTTGAVVELLLAAVVQRLRDALGKSFAPEAVAFRHRPLAPRPLYREVLGREPMGESYESAIVLRAMLLDEPMPSRDAAVHAALVASLKNASARPPLDRAQREDLRRAIEGLLDHRGSIATALAREFNTSRRSLQRRLQNLGTTLSELLREARRDRAMDLLAHDTISIAAISARVGFCDPAPFARAFRKWTGSTPSAWRAAKRNSTLPPPGSTTTPVEVARDVPHQLAG